MLLSRCKSNVDSNITGERKIKTIEKAKIFFNKNESHINVRNSSFNISLVDVF